MEKLVYVFIALGAVVMMMKFIFIFQAVKEILQEKKQQDQ